MLLDAIRRAVTSMNIKRESPTVDYTRRRSLHCGRMEFDCAMYTYTRTVYICQKQVSELSFGFDVARLHRIAFGSR